jgi:hypothetical protein
MSRALGFCVLLFAMALLSPTVAVSQAPQNPKPDDPAVMKAQYLRGTTVTGTVTKANGDADPKTVTVQVSWQSKVLDDDKKKTYDTAMQQYQQAVQQKNQGNVRKFGQQVQQASQNLYKNQTNTLDLDFICDKGATVRRNASPPMNTATFKDLDGDKVTVKVTLDRAKGSKMKKEELDAGYPITEILILPAKAPPPAPPKQ